jgi:hypothetical protein
MLQGMVKRLFIKLCLLQVFLWGTLVGQESLFLRAKGLCRDVAGEKSGIRKEFDVGNGKFEKGEFVCIANPTYDLTFKLLFTPMENKYNFQENLVSKESSERRLMSLLNSIFYPDFEEYPTNEHITRVELRPTELLASKDEIANEDIRKKLKALRCDIVCQCTVEKSGRRKGSTFFIYFDIEMQRADIPGRMGAFLRYRELLKDHFAQANEDSVKLVAFLNYKTQGLAVTNAVVAAVKIDPETGAVTLIDDNSVHESELSKIIGLPAVIEEIKGNKTIIVTGKPLKQNGKEWLKLLGVQWWATESKRKSHRYIVPCDISCDEVKESLKVLSQKGISDEALSKEYDKILSAEATAYNLEEKGRKEGEKKGREEGLKEGELKGKLESLMRNFIKGRGIDDDDVEGIMPQSLHNGFIHQVWEELKSTNKTEEKYGSFLQELEDRGLMAG